MGLRGQLPKIEPLIELLERGGRHLLVIHARLDGDDGPEALIELYRDDTDWIIEQLEVPSRYQRRGVATHLLNLAHAELASRFDEYEIIHNDRLAADGLAWAMAMDGGEGHRSWELANEDRIAERFDEGVLASEHDRHLQAALASDDMQLRARALERLDRAGRLQEVALPLEALYLDSSQAPQLDADTDEPLTVVRLSAGEYEDAGEPIWVVARGIDKVRGMLGVEQGQQVLRCEVTSELASGVHVERNNLVSLSHVLRPSLSPADAPAQDMGQEEPDDLSPGLG
jgi:hypothetical protein